MRYIVLQGQTTGSRQKTVLSGFSFARRRHEVDLGADADHAAGRRLRDVLRDELGRAVGVGGLHDLVAALGVDDDLDVRGTAARAASICVSEKRWCTEQWPCQRMTRERSSASIEAPPRRPVGQPPVPEHHLLERDAHRVRRCCGRGAGPGRRGRACRARRPTSRTFAGVARRCRRRRRARRRTPSARRPSSCR